MLDASVYCKVGARNGTLVVFANLFFMHFPAPLPANRQRQPKTDIFLSNQDIQDISNVSKVIVEVRNMQGSAWVSEITLLKNVNDIFKGKPQFALFYHMLNIEKFNNIDRIENIYDMDNIGILTILTILPILPILSILIILKMLTI